MALLSPWKTAVLAAAFSLLPAGSAFAQYTRTDLVTDTGTASHPPDPALVNAWGLVALPGSPFWVSDNGTGLSTLYADSGKDGGRELTKLGLVVTVEGAGGVQGTPTGIVGNSTGDFVLLHGGRPRKPALFIFAGLDGTISAWNGGNTVAAVVLTSQDGASYTGLAIGNNGGENLLYAADDGPNRKVDVYNGSFQPKDLGKDAFVDPGVPKEFAPYGIQTVKDAQGVETVWVTYTGLNKAQSGFAAGFTTAGVLKTHIKVNGPLHSPWGIALAPADFGPSSNALLIANNISRGRIDAFDPNSGEFLGVLRDTSGNPIEIDGIWSIQFGQDGGLNGAHNQLFFTAGPENYGHGTLGVITFE